MADVKWIKITTDMFDNRKIRHIRKLPEGNNIVLIWVMLLALAGRCNDGGRIFLTETIPYTQKMLADELGFRTSTIKHALEALEQFEMVSMDGDFIDIPGWQRHQNVDGMDRIREQNRIRQKRKREKENVMSQNESRDSNVTSRDSNATDKELDKEKEIYKEIYKEKKPDVTEPEPTPDRKPEISLPLNDNTEYPIYQEQIDEWTKLYPSVDIIQALRNMRGWLDANPKNRKTKNGIKRFVNGWLSREQDRPKTQKTDSKPKNSFANFEQRNTDYDALVAKYSGFGGRGIDS